MEYQNHKAQLLQRYAAGEKAADIAKDLGVTIGYLNTYVARHAPRTIIESRKQALGKDTLMGAKPEVRNYLDSQWETIHVRYTQGDPVHQIQADLGVVKVTLSKYLQQKLTAVDRAMRQASLQLKKEVATEQQQANQKAAKAETNKRKAYLFEQVRAGRPIADVARELEINYQLAYSYIRRSPHAAELKELMKAAVLT